MRLKVRSANLHLQSLGSRLPFRFGAVTLREARSAFLVIKVETADGRIVSGASSDLMVPKWFEKKAEFTPAEDSERLAKSVERAISCARALPVANAFQHGRELYRQLVAGVPTTSLTSTETEPSDFEPLLRGFGVALMERAVVDAACRAAGLSFWKALTTDVLGFAPDEVFDDLKGWDWRATLPDRPSRQLKVRHTVGGADPLRSEEISPEDRVDDGFPQALDDDIQRYGLSAFKVKIGQGHERDGQRLLSLATFFEEAAPDDFEITLDGNEQIEDLGALAEILEKVHEEPHGKRLLKRLKWIEQPLSRAATFDSARNRAADVDRCVKFAPLIIDEADADCESFQDAYALGYRGVSVKNCKGMFRALLTRGRIASQPELCFQSAEDLTNLSGVALQQNLMTMSCLGLDSVELNGHHYFAGLKHLSESTRMKATSQHPELYSGPAGNECLHIEGGHVRFDSLFDVGYAHNFDIGEGD